MELSKERKPLLSDEEIIDETWVPDMSSWEPAGAYEAGMHWARRYYEDLITTGKLRVVEEVKYLELPGLVRNCSKCDQLSEAISAKYYVYCPGCGSKIKR